MVRKGQKTTLVYSMGVCMQGIAETRHIPEKGYEMEAQFCTKKGNPLNCLP